MIIRTLMFIAISFVSMACYSADQYANAKIESIEVCQNSSQYKVRLFLKDVIGTMPAGGDGCSNGEVFPYVSIMTGTSDLQSRNPMLSLALTAYASGLRVRLRYDDANYKLVSLSLLSN